jgi:hypothetical protein
VKTIVLTLAAILAFNTAQALQTYEEATLGLTNENLRAYHDDHLREFYKSKSQPTDGYEIIGFDSRDNISSVIRMKYINEENINVCLIISKPHWSVSGELFISLIDQDGYQISEVHFERIRASYTGKIYPSTH